MSKCKLRVISPSNVSCTSPSLVAIMEQGGIKYRNEAFSGCIHHKTCDGTYWKVFGLPYTEGELVMKYLGSSDVDDEEL